MSAGRCFQILGESRNKKKRQKWLVLLPTFSSSQIISIPSLPCSSVGAMDLDPSKEVSLGQGRVVPMNLISAGPLIFLKKSTGKY